MVSRTVVLGKGRVSKLCSGKIAQWEMTGPCFVSKHQVVSAGTGESCQRMSETRTRYRKSEA